MKDFKTTLDEVRKTWMEENPCEDGHDHVTPFDKFYYGNYTLREPAGVGGEWVLVPRDLAESAMQSLYTASNGRQNIYASTADEFRDMLAAAPQPPAEAQAVARGGASVHGCAEQIHDGNWDSDAYAIDHCNKQAQGGGEVWPVWTRDEALEVLRNVDAQFRATGQKSARIERLINLIAGLPDPAPPSAPVGVEGLLECLPLEVRSANGYDAAWAAGFNEGVLQSRQNLRRALAQQPPACDMGALTPTGTFCSVCEAPQHNTPSGVSCPNGHGGVAALSQQPAADAEWIKHPQTIEAKAQWDAVAQALGADGDDPDAVLAAARRAQQPAAVDGAMWKFVADAFDNMTMSESERFLELLRLPDDHAWLQLHWHIQRALTAQPGGSDNDR